MSSPDSQIEAHRLRAILIDAAIMTIIGVVLALIGPFGTIAEPFALRLIRWLAYVYTGYLAYKPVWAIAGVLANRLNLPRTGLLIAGCLLATIPAAAAIWIIGFLPGQIPAPTLENAFSTYLNVLVIGASIMAVFYLIERGRAAGAGSEQHKTMPAAAPDAGRPMVQPPRFADRLPPELGTDLIALEMEDHYVRAHTALGSDLLLMRLRDAIAELDGIEGEQVHRSWWVARGAVEDIRRDGRNIRLILTGGLAAPVSRANTQRLKDQGWL